MAKQVTIVGAGIVGICTAVYLREKGLAVEVVDRDPPAEGASHGNAGVVSPWTCVPQSMPGLWRSVPRWLLDPEGPIALRWPYLPSFLPWAIKFLRAGNVAELPQLADAMKALNRPNIELYRQLLQGTGSEHLISDSFYVHIYRDPAEIDLKQLGWQLRLDRDVPLEVVDDGALHELEPALSPRYKAAVLIKSQARALSPGGVGKALVAKAQDMGAVFRQTGVNRIAPQESGGWRLQTDDGEITSDKVVIAAGAWSARLLAPLLEQSGLNLPLEAERGYHLILQQPGITVNNSIMDTESKFVASSMLAGVRCAGTAEFAGLDAAPNYRRAEIFKGLAKRLFPDINTDDPVEWMGSRPSFPDSLPCIGTVPGQRDLFAAFGHSHYGFGMAPNTGRITAALVAGEPTDVDLTPYRMARFK
jgi:D-amino-acid dehydrogenase